MIVGRDPEQAALAALVDSAGNGRGGALVLRGEAGIGKSTLLQAAADLAEQAGARCLDTAGVQAEVHIPYASVHRLLLGSSSLAGLAQDVLSSPDTLPYQAAARMLSALAELDETVVITVDDLQWMDESSWQAMAFVARRLVGTTVAMVLTARDGDSATNRLARAGLPERRLAPLSIEQARVLLTRAAPGLATMVRTQVLDTAAGNPLGLVELGSQAARAGALATQAEALPLTERLEQTFSGLVQELAPDTRVLLLVAALDDGDGVDEIVRATNLLTGQPVGRETVAPAVAARLVSVDEQLHLRFRHPLLRSALHRGADEVRRRQVHAALAEALSSTTERALWHRAAAAEGPDDDLADALALAATRAQHRQAPGTARRAFERAARLSRDPSVRARRLLMAADLAAEHGDLLTHSRLLAEIHPPDLSPGERSAYELAVEIRHATHWSGSDGLVRAAEAIDLLVAEGEVERAVGLADKMSLRVYFSEPDPAAVDRLAAALDRATRTCDDPKLLAALALTSPLRHGPRLRQEFRQRLARADSDPYSTFQMATAAGGLGDDPVGCALHAMAQVGLREQGRLGVLCQSAISHALIATYLGDARTAASLLPEAEELARQTGASNWVPAAILGAGAIHALRGESAAAAERAAQAEAMLLPYGRNALLSGVRQVRGTVALAQGRFEEAFSELRRIFDLQDDGYHPSTGQHLVGYLAEAAAGCGATAGLRRLIADLTPVAETGGSPALLIGLGFARTVLNDTAEAYDKAVGEDLAGWPFELARRQHAYGTWLRRHRRPAESRPLLRSAATTFDSLGAHAWAARSLAELRASGESLRRVERGAPVGAGPAGLTPQETQIARLAAEGLSTRDIAERLYLSPRTVSTHLSRIYRKLGIRSRSELSRVLPDL